MDVATIRLPDDLARSLERIATRQGVTRSEVMREALVQYSRAAEKAPGIDRVALLQELVTYSGSGQVDLGTRSKEHLREIFAARRKRRSR